MDEHEHEKDSSASGSLENSGTESPPESVGGGGGGVVVVPQIMNMAVNMSMERNFVSGGSTTMISPSTGGSEKGSSVDLLSKKKRGRPRKYDADGNLRVSYTSPQPSFPPGFVMSPPSYEFSSSKRGRGRPPGSGNWQLLASLGGIFADTAGGDFTPHVVTVSTGEDVAGKIVSLGQKGPRGICVLSANGAVSNVTIRQPGTSGGILTYEGRFEILSLTGSFTITDNGGVKSRTGGLSVSVAGPDGRVVGGGIAGSLLAASPIQIVVGSFTPNGYKVHKRKHHRQSPIVSTTPSSSLDTAKEAMPISQAAPVSETYRSSTSPSPGQSHEGDENDKQQMPNVSVSYGISWNNGSDPISAQRPSPDINISIHGD